MGETNPAALGLRTSGGHHHGYERRGVMLTARRALPVAAVAAALALIAALAAAPRFAGAADHLDAPGLMSPGGVTELDINDVYAFAGTRHRTVLAMTVSPVATADSSFATGFEGTYALRIDKDGDAVEDLSFDVRFFDKKGKGQIVAVQRAIGPNATDPAPRGKLRGVGVTNHGFRLKGGGKAFAGLRSDPFFFDLSGFLGTVEGIGEDGLGNDPTDFFEDLNTLAIVLEIPDWELNRGDAIGVWATTDRPDASGKWRQVDRMGRPAINTVVNSSGPIVGAPSNNKNVYNAGLPKNDAAFRPFVVSALQAFSSLDSEGSYSNTQAGALADVLLPDILTYDKNGGTLPPPLNGRGLADDVIDTELRIVTGGDPLGLFDDRDADGGLNGDGVGAHGDYLASFPYLGRPHS